MAWSVANNGAICAPGSCSPSQLAFIALLTQYLGFSYDSKFKLTNPDDDSEHFDFIVVGAGSAGCVVANRLSENENWKVGDGVIYVSFVLNSSFFIFDEMIAKNFIYTEKREEDSTEL